MAKVEIEEAELLALRNVRTFANTALQNPKTRKQMLAIDKALNPDKPIPELDAAEQVMTVVNDVKAQVDGIMKKLDERQTSDETSRATAALAARVQAGQEYLAKNGYAADGIEKIEALMLQENIASYAAGLALFERLNPPASPADVSRTSRFGSLSDQDLGTDDNKELWESQGQSESWFQKSLDNVRRDFRGH